MDTNERKAQNLIEKVTRVEGGCALHITGSLAKYGLKQQIFIDNNSVGP